MAKNHLWLVRFEATDLHGVSRSKSIPAHFFQVTFTSRVMAECNFMTISKPMVYITLSYFVVIHTASLAEKEPQNKPILYFVSSLVPSQTHYCSPRSWTHNFSSQTAIPLPNRNIKLIKTGNFTPSALNNFPLQSYLFSLTAIMKIIFCLTWENCNRRPRSKYKRGKIIK